MNLFESIKSNYEKKEKINKLIEKRKSLKESQKLNEAEVDVDRFAKDLETSLRDNGFKVETNDYRVFTVSAYDRYTVIEIYEADDINNMFEEVASIGIGGDYGDKSIKLIDAPGWEVDTAGGKDVYALFKIMSETTPEEVSDIILKSYQQTPKDDKLNMDESDNNQLDKVRDIANDLVEYLRKDGISAELVDYDTIDYHGPAGKITYSISWGDWKHDHLASEELAKNFFGSNINIDEVVTEEDGSDTYSANHEITFDLDNYLNSQDGDKMSEAEKLDELDDKDNTSSIYIDLNELINYAEKYINKELRMAGGSDAKITTTNDGQYMITLNRGDNSIKAYCNLGKENAENDLNETE